MGWATQWHHGILKVKWKFDDDSPKPNFRRGARLIPSNVRASNKGLAMSSTDHLASLGALRSQAFSACPRKQAGVTLLELLITLSIAAILVTLTAPSFQDLIRRNRATTQSNELLTALNLARSEAVKRGRRVSVCSSANPMVATPVCSGSSNWATGWIVFVDTSTSDASVTVGQVLRVWSASAGVTLTATAANVRFKGTGEAIDPLDFTLAPTGCAGTQARAIDVNPIGRAAVTETACP